MRKRNVSLMFRMTETEAMELDRKVKTVGALQRGVYTCCPERLYTA